MNRLAAHLSTALIVALGLLGCDSDEKPTGPQPSPGPAIAHFPALVSPHSGAGWDLPEPDDIALPPLLPGPDGSALPRSSFARTDLEQATEVVWGAMLGTEPSDPVVAGLLADVPVLMSGIRQIKGRLYLYLGIDRAYFNRHGGEHIYHTLTKRFPTVPFYIEPSDGVQLLSATRAAQEVVPAGKAAGDDLFDLFGAFNDGPDLIVQSVSVSDTMLTPGQAFTLNVTVHNQGNQQAAATVLRYYRSNNATITASDTEVGTEAVAALDASASRAHSIELTAPNVSSPRVGIYYGACVASVSGERKTDNNCSPAVKTVVHEQETADDAVDTPVDVDRLLEVMGGDPLRGHFRASEQNYRTTDNLIQDAATLTLGGLTTTNGPQGFVMSGHAAIALTAKIFDAFKAGETDALIFGGYDKRTRTFPFKAFLGKVMQLPHIQEKGKRFEDEEFFYADAAFVAYPSLATANCSLTWTGDDTNRTFCLDLGKGEQIETVKSLAIRGKHNATYTVVGSKSPTMGLEVMFSGGTSGVAEGNRVTSGAMLTRQSSASGEGGLYYTYDINGGQESLGGDSGSPIYTVPDKDGNVSVVGVLQGAIIVAGEGTTIFSSWDDVVKEFDLQPIR